LAAIAVPCIAEAQPPWPSLPGVNLNKTESYWLAPYVKVIDEEIGHGKTQTVTWLSDDGSVKRQIASSEQIVFNGTPSYAVEKRENGQNVVYGINESWKCVLPKRPPIGMNVNPVFVGGPISASLDSHTLIDPFSPESGKMAFDVYVHGVLAGTLGPFVLKDLSGAQMNDDGSTAVLIWNDATKTTPQIICADRNGKMQFRVDCGAADPVPIPAPDGLGALLSGGKDHNTFTCYTRDGKGRSVEIGPNPVCVGWIPGTLKSLFSTSIEHVARYQLVDWDRGEAVWDIPCPGGGEALAVTVTQKLAIFAIAEWYKPGAWAGFQMGVDSGGKDLIRTFYAIRTEDGRAVSRWQAHAPMRYGGQEKDRFMQIANKLFFVTVDKFIQLVEDDILSRNNGWEPVAGSK
jgi:hypothetical protein